MKKTVAFVTLLGLVTLLVLMYQYVDLSWRVLHSRDSFVAVITKYESAASSRRRNTTQLFQKLNSRAGVGDGGGGGAGSLHRIVNDTRRISPVLPTTVSTPPVANGPLHIPQKIADMFPLALSNTTALTCTPPGHEYNSQKSTHTLIDGKYDIFHVLLNWDKLNQPFYPDFYRLRIKNEDIPKPKLNIKGLYRPVYTQKIKPVWKPVHESCPVYTKCDPNRKTYNLYSWRRFVECSSKVREPTPSELEGNHILFTLRTCAKFHRERLPRLFHTWLENVNRSNVVIVTDDIDPVLQYRAAEAGIRCYAVSVPGYMRLCEKAGDEVSLMFLPENQHYQWLCHVDDDMYVNMDRLVDVLANFKHDEPVYFGRAGSYPGKERLVTRNARLGKPGSRYHFAVGGMYCLNRALLNKARRWIGGREAFGKMCRITEEPEDVTIGFLVGIVLGHHLNHTELIQSHGNDLEGVDPFSLKYQVAISYGFGAVNWMNRETNAVRVPKALFSLQEDPSQFLSIHCHHHPNIGWCLHKLHQLSQR